MNPQRMDKLARIEAGDYPATHDLVTMAQAVNYNRFLTDVIRRELGDRRVVVDHGAGLGTLALLLRERGVAPVCVENEPAHMAHLREEGFRVVGSTAELPDASADFIYSLNVLEHIDDDAAELRAMRAKLTPDGRVFLYMPAFMSLYSTMDKRVGHRRRYDRAGLSALAEKAGFEVVWSSYSDSLGGLLSVVYKWMNNPKGEINPRYLRWFDRFVYPPSLWLDRWTAKWFGKNAMAVLRPRPSGGVSPAPSGV
ncbi:MAG: methyltransferase domain-containing protein [Elusimicrobia bacterium]|nr:methyltransferase domain-containing protein [Elusimicrobiota bacterium]MBK7207240.1 methyltransferase domain-containing protein [Elusimicrobiota bacterium]MBK7687406.1 methyltransferase domain-containing protein [Elusimicrobiota bacterium]MBK8125680.1 methyltransferase domain-containing protein [Elusimicrobiota bacterium]MBK8423038.1 methyltransferase domain-containing protein [Elusimicrobiota bacterium]